MPFELPRLLFEDLVTDGCFYCGQLKARERAGRHTSRRMGGLPRNGIDRVDSSKGYVIGNVVTCCFDCNHAKQKLPVRTFLERSIRIATRFKMGEELL
jgi:hypothetical protein